MPGKLKVRVVSARNLPVMDRASELTDAFVEVKFGSTILKTEVFKKSLNPQWNSDWFRFEVDDEDLQDEPLQIRVLDHDTYTSHDAIGKIYIDLNPLLNDNKTSTFGGWYPIYDTMHGIQGQLYVVIKIDLFSDLNKFRKSSCGVKFFCTSRVPEGYQIETFLGFVEELTVNDDPEYQWIDRIRSMRASNEARQMIFSKLSGQLQRKIGLKVLEMGGNAVIGYRQCFDLEGESGVVVRAIGTCVTLRKVIKLGQGSSPAVALNTSGGLQIESKAQDCSAGATLSTVGVNSNLPVPVSSAVTGQSGSGFFPSLSPTCMASLTCHSINMPSSTAHGKQVAASRRLSESDAETPAKGGGPLTANTGLLNLSKTPFHRPIMQQENIEMMEYPFFTMRLYPRGCIKHLGGVVSATSVKLLDKMNDPDEPKTRDLWWAEIRTEIRSHTRALNCNCVLGYSERTSIRDELIILSANGTAAILNPSNIISAASSTEELADCRKGSCGQSNRSKGRTGSLTCGSSAPASNGQPTFWLTDPKLNRKYQREIFMGKPSVLGRPRLLSVSDNEGEENDSMTVTEGDVGCRDNENTVGHVDVMNKSDEDAASDSSSISVFPQCSICHIPYHERELPFPVNLCKCLVCQQYKVPDIIFCTIEPPEELPIVGKGCLIQARICRPKREGKGESNAKEVSDSLPFVEYELHKQLVNKLKVKGMNSLFGLTIQLTVGESLVVAVATATGVYSEPLPPPGPPLIINKNDSTLSEVELRSIRSNLTEAIKRNKEAYKITEQAVPKPGGIVVTDVEDFSIADVKWPDETFVFEIDDTEDAQVVSVLLEPPYPVDFEFCNTERMPGIEGIVVCNLQMFTKIWRGSLKSACNSSLDAVVDNVMKSLFFKFRGMRPCVICKLEFDLDLTNDDELQILITGMCSGIGRIVDQVVEESGRTSSNTLVSKMSVSKQGNSFDKMDHCFDTIEPQPPMIESPSALTNFRMGGGATCDSRHNVSSSIMSSISIAENHRLKHHSSKTKPFGIQLSPLSWVPRATVLSYMGHLNFFLIRESTSVREDGGLNCFMHSFLAEVMAICRSHVRSLGGNALVSFRIVECTLQNNVHKNQSQCLVNVFGDAVNVVYDPDSVTASHLSLEQKAANKAEEPTCSRL